jgi:hypothetical protein
MNGRKRINSFPVNMAAAVESRNNIKNREGLLTAAFSIFQKNGV